MTFTIPIIVSIIIGVNQGLKVAGVPTKYIPGITVVLGVAAGIFFLPGTNLQETLYNGISVGLGSIGLFAVAKSTVPQPTYYKVIDDGQMTSVTPAPADADEEAPEAVNQTTIGF